MPGNCAGSSTYVTLKNNHENPVRQIFSHQIIREEIEPQFGGLTKATQLVSGTCPQNATVPLRRVSNRVREREKRGRKNKTEAERQTHSQKNKAGKQKISKRREPQLFGDMIKSSTGAIPP